MLRPPEQDLQDEHIQRALQQLDPVLVGFSPRHDVDTLLPKGVESLQHPSFSLYAKSLAPYRHCSTSRVRLAEDFGVSIVDTAICAKPGEVLAGQLLYGDSIHRSYFVLT
jgi:hypothetical protein